MKKLSIILIAAAILAASAFAQYDDYGQGYGGGFQDDGTAYAAPTPIKKALRMRDDSYVTVRGRIIKRLTDDNFLFADETGQIVVDIDYEDWGGVTASPKDTLELTGEIDRDFNKVKLDVKIVRKVSGPNQAPQQGFQE